MCLEYLLNGMQKFLRERTLGNLITSFRSFWSFSRMPVGGPLDSSDPVLGVSIATTVTIRSCSSGGQQAVEAVDGVAELDKMKTEWTTKTFVNDLSHREYSSQSPPNSVHSEFPFQQSFKRNQRCNPRNISNAKISQSQSNDGSRTLLYLLIHSY